MLARHSLSKLAYAMLSLVIFGVNSDPTLAGKLKSPPPWVGLIGVDYNPNHYVDGQAFNFHDVFYVGSNANGKAITNVYAELQQLKAAGFNTVRSYQTVEYSWIDIIRRANSLGMFVVYEAVIPESGGQSDISNAVAVLNNVIGAVGAPTFGNTVTLVFAGHENYNGSNVGFLTSAIQQLQGALSNAGLAQIPVGSALVSGNLVTPGNPADMQTLINSYSAAAPLAFDPYPFQWGVWPPDQAVTNAALTNSIAWDYAQVVKQPFYTTGRPILMAETGWASKGSGQYQNYYCYQQQNCQPGVNNAATYLQALYGFVQNASNNAGALIFEAYSEPAKDPANPNDAENHYGVFNSKCVLKNKNTNLLPNTGFSPNSQLGCQGFTSGVLFTVAGTQPGNLTNQPPFTVSIQQTNPTTSRAAYINAKIPNQDRTDQNVNPWPEYLVFNGATITISGTTSGASCTFTASVAAPSPPTWSAPSCTNSGYAVNCSGNICYLPWNNF